MSENSSAISKTQSLESCVSSSDLTDSERNLKKSYAQPQQQIQSTDEIEEPYAQAYVPVYKSISSDEIGVDAWAEFGDKDTGLGTIEAKITGERYLDTSVGQRDGTNPNLEPDLSTQGITGPGAVVSNANTSMKSYGYDCAYTCDSTSTASIGSIQSCIEAMESSVTSFSSVNDEIRKCEDDVDKIAQLLELKPNNAAAGASKCTLDDSTSETSSQIGGNINNSSCSSNAKKNKSTKTAKCQGKCSRSRPIHAGCTTCSKKSSSKQRQQKRTSVSPKRKLIICDGKVGLADCDAKETHKDEKSPYNCEFFNPKCHPPKGKQYHEVYVSEKQYRVIQSVIPQKNTTQTPSVPESQRTLFGYVAFSSYSSSSPETSAIPTPTPTSGEKQIPPQFARSRSKLGKFTTASKTGLGLDLKPASKSKSKEDKETQTMKKVDFAMEVEVAVEATNELMQSQDEDQSVHETSVSTSTTENEICLEEVVSITDTINVVIEGNLECATTHEPEPEQIMTMTMAAPSSQAIDRENLETIGHSMCRDVFTASETSIVLVNTVFKDIVLSSDSNISTILATNPKFQEFITSSNEMGALERAAEIYASAAEKIKEYLKSARNEQIHKIKDWSASASTSASASASARSRCNSVSVVTDDDVEIVDVSKLAEVQIQDEDEEIKSRSRDWNSLATCVENQSTNLSNIWSFAPELRLPEKFEMCLTSRPGILLETIDCSNWQFSISYMGGPERINLLSTATRERSAPVYLNPQCLLEMVDRNSSAAASRLSSSKYYLSRVSEKLSELVHEFLFGKYVKPKSKFTKGYLAKLKAQNVFTGIIFQLSVSFLTVTKKIQGCIEKAMKLDDALRCPRLPGLKFVFEDKDQDLPPGAAAGGKVPMTEAIQELAICMGDIDALLHCGSISLASLSVGNIKVKKSYRNLIIQMIDAVKQLEFGHDVDFGAVIMSLACNAAVIQSLADIVPTVDVDVRSRILSNLNHLNCVAEDVVRFSKRVSLLSSFVAGRTFTQLSKFNRIRIQSAELKRRRRNGKKSDMNLEEGTQFQSNPSAQDRIVQRKKSEESKKLEELREQLSKIIK